MINSTLLTPPSLLSRNNQINFSGNKAFYDDFKKEVKQAYGNTSMKDVLNNAMANAENKIGEGGEKVVYQIPFVDDYLVAKIKFREHSEAPIRQSKELSELEYNFGQPIATNGKDIIVMQKVNGESYSTDNWLFTFIGAAQGRKNITEPQAQAFLNQIERISEFPLSSYISLAKQVKCLSNNDIKMDCFNPNNLLIDWDKKEINHIDIMDEQERFDELERPLNSTYDMINLLCDAFLNLKYLEAFEDKADAKRLKDATKEVIKKCHIAGNIVGLEKTDTNIKEACRISDETSLKAHGLSPLFVDAYNEFEKTYDKSLNSNVKNEQVIVYRYHNPYNSTPHIKTKASMAAAL